jgi:hypothetical protein
METRFSTPSKKACFTSLFDCPPRKSGQAFEFSLEWCSLVIHPAHAARTRFFFPRQLHHQCFCGEHESGDRSGVLERRPDHLDDTGLQVLVFAARHVKPFIALPLTLFGLLLVWLSSTCHFFCLALFYFVLLSSKYSIISEISCSTIL